MKIKLLIIKSIIITKINLMFKFKIINNKKLIKQEFNDDYEKNQSHDIYINFVNIHIVYRNCITFFNSKSKLYKYLKKKLLI